MKIRLLAAGTAATAAAALVALAPTASAGVPQPLPEEQAQALIAATAPGANGSVTRRATPQEVLAAASAPGSVVAVAPGLTPRQAVGLGAAALASGVAASPAAVQYGCNANVAWRQWGTWPYEQKISDTTYWCAYYGQFVTYWSSSVAATGTICGGSWTTSQLISGGIGYTWFVLRSSAGWSCPTVVPWVSLHPSHYIDISRNAWGNAAEVGSN